MDLLLALSILGNLIVGLFLFLCAALILIILLQKGRGGGLGAAFGGGGAGSLLGTKTGDFLTWVTIALVAGFLVLAVLMGKFMRPSVSSSSLAAPAPVGAEQDVTGGQPDVTDETSAPAVDGATEAAEAAEGIDVEAIPAETEAVTDEAASGADDAQPVEETPETTE